MIQAVIFDLDGTLVQTEKLKAMSYARAAVKLCPRRVNEEEVVEAFKEVVGRSRQEVSIFLMERFALEEAARSRPEHRHLHSYRRCTGRGRHTERNL